MLILIREPYLHECGGREGLKIPHLNFRLPMPISANTKATDMANAMQCYIMSMQCNITACQYANASSSLHSCHVLKPAQTGLVLFKATLLELPQLLLLANLHSFLLY